MFNLIQKNTILIISDWPIYPIKNGMQLAIAHQLDNLRKFYQIDLLIISDYNQSFDNYNHEMFENVFHIKLNLISKYKAILKELAILQPSYFRYLLNKELLSRVKDYKNIWVTNAKIASLGPILRSYYSDKHITLTTNDAIYYFYLERSIASILGKEQRNISSIFNFFRLPFLILNERKYLNSYNRIQVQTSLEKRRLCFINNKCCSSVRVISNPVKENLLSIPIKSINSKNILLMNHMTGGREYQAIRFLNHIWPKVLEMDNSLKLIVVGDLPVDFNLKYKNVIFKGYVKDLKDVYTSVGISIIPHFQSSGYINRLYDSMAAGIPVIISKKIAKTCPEFKNDIHGIIFDNDKELVNRIVNYFSEPKEKKINYALRGRELVLYVESSKKSSL